MQCEVQLLTAFVCKHTVRKRGRDANENSITFVVRDQRDGLVAEDILGRILEHALDDALTVSDSRSIHVLAVHTCEVDTRSDEGRVVEPGG